MRVSLATSLAVVLLLALGASCGRGDTRDDALSAAEAAGLLTDRNWLDHWPTGPRERLEVYRFTPAMGGGVYQDRTLFAGHFELFNFEVMGERLRIRWPDRDLVEDLGFRIVPVDGPPPFDLRLEIEGNAIGPHVLFGRRAEGAGAAGAVDAPGLPVADVDAALRR